MKSIKIFISVIILSLGINMHAQPSIKTESIKVYGNCDMCKARIEKALKIDGVSKANWNAKTKILTIVYDTKKLKSEDIQKKVAAAGHDTDKVKADNKTYNSLPGCCQYR
jgi:periplasmic mercuric ion binding protein